MDDFRVGQDDDISLGLIGSPVERNTWVERIGLIGKPNDATRSTGPCRLGRAVVNDQDFNVPVIQLPVLFQVLIEDGRPSPVGHHD